MAGVVKRQWTYDVTIIENNNPEQSVKIVVWDSDSSTAIVSQQTDSSGQISQQTITEAIYSVTLTDTVSTDSKTPHTISCLKYGLSPFALTVNFTSSRDDTYYMESDTYIDKDYSTVSAYTGITVDHSNQKITIDDAHTLQELYDYCQYNIFNNPQKSFPSGFFNTQDGITYYSEYDIIVDGVLLTGQNKTLNLASGKDVTVLSVGSIKDLKILGDLTWNTQITVENVDVTGTWYFDSNVNLSMTDCEVNAVDTVDGTETVVIALYDSSVDTNNDTSNIEIRNPVWIKVKVSNSDGDPISGARVYIKKVSDNTVIVNELTDSNGEVTESYNYTSDTDITGRIRKSSTSPYYKTYNLSGTITDSGYTVNAIMIEDN